MIDIKVVTCLPPTVVNNSTAGVVVDRQGGGDNGDDDSINALRVSANFMLGEWGCSPADDGDLERLLSAMRNGDDAWTAGDILMRELVNLGLEKLRISYYAGDEAEALISAIRLCAPGKKRPCKVCEERVMPDWVATEVDRVFPKGKRLAELRRRNSKLGRLVAEIRLRRLRDAAALGALTGGCLFRASLNEDSKQRDAVYEQTHQLR